MMPIPKSLTEIVNQVRDTMPHPKIAAMFEACFLNTWQTTLRPQPDGSTFVITGDIPAMWLRDSSAQVRPYLSAVHDPVVANMLIGVSKLQARQVMLDAYANAFNDAPSGNGHQTDRTTMHPSLWERKYEVDSLASVLELAHLIWQRTKRVDHLDKFFAQAARRILEVWKLEQHHTQSTYSFERPNAPATDSLGNNGRGTNVGFTGMTWSGFRPSDDACTFGYLIPSNMLASVALKHLQTLALEVFHDTDLAQQAAQLALEIKTGIETHGKIVHPQFGEIYAYEVNGLGEHHLMDDANVPSLISAPYLRYCHANDPTYQATRALLLSSHNPYYFSGSAAKGIGSPHTPHDYIWHIALCMQGMTSVDPDEQNTILEMLGATDAGTGLMHEGFHKDNPGEYTRAWFAWANSLFAEFVMQQCGIVAGQAESLIA